MLRLFQKVNMDEGFVTLDEIRSELKRIVCDKCGCTFHMYQPSSYIFCPFCKSNARNKQELTPPGPDLESRRLQRGLRQCPDEYAPTAVFPWTPQYTCNKGHRHFISSPTARTSSENSKPTAGKNEKLHQVPKDKATR